MEIASTDPELVQPFNGRRESRISARFKVGVRDGSGAVFQADSLNLSLGGLCLQARQDYPPGHALQLEVALGAEPLDLRGIVAWNRPDEAAVGVHFVDVSEEAERRLETVVWLLAGLAPRPW
jgi:uncharacterized protein (TIGR02266 family)